MVKHYKEQQLPILLSQAKTLLIVFSAILIVANLYFLSATRELARSYSEQHNQASWFLFQLTKEFSELVSITPFAADHTEYDERMKLKYELTWSRFDVLMHSKESDDIMALEGAYSFFSEMFTRFKALENQLEVKSSEEAKQLSQAFNNIYLTTIQYVNANFRLKSPLYQAQMQQAQMLTHVQFLLMFLLFTCAGLVSYILHKEALHHKSLAITDPLTGILNRLALLKALESNIQRQRPFTLFILDLNGFKSINDSYGHQAGDHLLRVFSHRLSTQSDSLNYQVYRIGGDEFSIILNDIECGAIENIEQMVRQCVKEKIELSSSYEYLSTSVGMARYPDDSTTMNQLISQADHSMYKMKFADRP
ncbi:GGDEF domain-containing protein [Vibrio sp. NTOU-M3]|uniref:GGDEF domain-containing protein n=1 Tax=Vibrio sp. NTOU-M3 TaxID=3234954 RepID=UPI00349FC4CC